MKSFCCSDHAAS